MKFSKLKVFTCCFLRYILLWLKVQVQLANFPGETFIGLHRFSTKAGAGTGAGAGGTGAGEGAGHGDEHGQGQGQGQEQEQKQEIWLSLRSDEGVIGVKYHEGVVIGVASKQEWAGVPGSR